MILSRQLVLISLAALASSAPGLADELLSDGNSTAILTSSGLTNWTVNGVDQIASQWYWFRIGSTGGEAAIDTLSSPTVTQFGSKFAELTYQNSSFKINLIYILSGGTLSGGNSDIAEIVDVTNETANTLDFHLFEYSAFLLNGVGQQTVSFPNSNTVQVMTGGGVFSQTTVNPQANSYEADSPGTLLGTLNDGSPTILNDSPALGSSVGPGNDAWALEWDVPIAPYGSFIMSEDNLIDPVPEPYSVALLGSVLALVGYRIRRRPGSWSEPK